MHRILIPVIVGILISLGIWGILIGKDYLNGVRQRGTADEIRDVTPLYEITPGQLAVEYQADEETARQKYEGEVILVSGLIKKFSGVTIHFSTIEEWEVKCHTPNSQRDDIDEVIESHRSLPITTARVQMKGKVGDFEKRSLTSIVNIDGCTLQQVLPYDYRALAPSSTSTF